MPSTANEPTGWETFKNLIRTPDLPSLGPSPRSTRAPLTVLDEKLDQQFSRAQLPGTVQPILRSAAYLWHDYLDESHSLAQNIHNRDGSFLHGIMHRREPDYGNAKYWFRKVGEHPSFVELAHKAGALLESKSDKALKSQLLGRGQWDPLAFVDACEQNAGRSASEPRVQLLQGLQEIEFDALLAHLFRGLRQA